MTLDPLARFYPAFASRIAELEDALESLPRILIERSMVRDLPATVLRTRLVGGGPLWDGGYLMHHHRYVRRGRCPALHLSDGVTTAAAEAFGIAPASAPVMGVPAESRLQLVVEARIPRVIDLTDESNLNRLAIARDELIRIPDWSCLDVVGRPGAYELPQLIGELAYLSTAGGILYPAARATAGANLVVFTSHLSFLRGMLKVEDPFTGRAHTRV